MKERIKQQLIDLTNQNGLDESFVERILTAMERPIATYTDTPVAENETLVSTASILEKGILTVAMQIKDESDTEIGDKNIDDLRADRELAFKLLSLKREFGALQSSFWSVAENRLVEEGVVYERGNLGIRKDFQIVSMPPMEMDSSIADLLAAKGIFALMSNTTDRKSFPSEILEQCPCPACQAELARRKESEGK